MEAQDTSDAGNASQPGPPAHTRRIAFLNQKGGVGKTTTTCNLGAALAEAGCRVLLIDLDPQSHLSLHLGVDGETSGATVYDLFLDPDLDVADVLVQVRPNLWLIPATVDLATAESELAGSAGRNEILDQHIKKVMQHYDCVLIDCPPSLGLLTINALAAVDELFIPMQAHFLALQGVGKLLETVALVSKGVNDQLTVSGVVLCNHETQSTHGKEVVGELEQFFEESRGSGQPWQDAKVFKPVIRRNIKLAEAPSFGQTIFDYAPWCPGAIDYRTLAERLLREWAGQDSAVVSATSEPKPDTASASEASEPTEKLAKAMDLDTGDQGAGARNSA